MPTLPEVVWVGLWPAESGPNSEEELGRVSRHRSENFPEKRSCGIGRGTDTYTPNL